MPVKRCCERSAVISMHRLKSHEKRPTQLQRLCLYADKLKRLCHRTWCENADVTGGWDKSYRRGPILFSPPPWFILHRVRPIGPEFLTIRIVLCEEPIGVDVRLWTWLRAIEIQYVIGRFNNVGNFIYRAWPLLHWQETTILQKHRRIRKKLMKFCIWTLTILGLMFHHFSTFMFVVVIFPTSYYPCPCVY